MFVDTAFFYMGLSLIAVGSGLFKGNIFSLLGDHYKEDPAQRSRGFTIFFVSISFGAFFAGIACGYIAKLYGWHLGFSIAGLGVLLGVFTFFKYQHHLYPHCGLPPSTELANRSWFGMSLSTITFLTSLAISVPIAMILRYSEYFSTILPFCGVVILIQYIHIMINSSPETRINLLILMMLLIFKLMFYSMELQIGSFINLFTARNVSGHFLGLDIPAAASQSINPFSIILLGFLMGRYMKFDPKNNVLRFGFGLFTMVICFFILYLGCLNVDANAKVPYIYLFTAISFMGLGELLISPFVYSQASQLAPKNLKGFFMGVMMLSMAYSSFAGIPLSRIFSVPSIHGKVNLWESLSIYKTGFYYVTIFSLSVFFVFLLFAPFIHKYTYKKKDSVLESQKNL